MPFSIVQNDITNLKVDAIVNAANTELKMGGGVCGDIFKKAGKVRLQEACDKIAPIKTDEAVITSGFDLPAKYIIHTAGPVYDSRNKEKSKKYLYDSYTNSMKIAVENNCESIAFPLISSGIYGYPKDEALRVANLAINDFILNQDLYVILVIHNKEGFSINNKIIDEVENNI